MRKIFATIFVVGFVLSFCLPQSFASGSDSEVGEIFFVSSIEELAQARFYRDRLKGLAISVQFYNKTSEKFQKKIEELVAHIISLKFRPVYVYGQPFDGELAKKLLPYKKGGYDGSNCTPTTWAGIFPTIDLEDNLTSTMLMCMMHPSNSIKENQHREMILKDWQHAKETFKRWGYKLLE